MKKKKLLVLLPLISSAIGLSGCETTKVNPYDLDFTIDTNGTTIQMWHPFGSDIGGYLEEVVDLFTEETGIKVELEGKGGYDNLQKAINLGASKRKIPGVTLAYPDHMASYVNNDSILRLDYFFENDGEDFKMDDFYADYMVENQSIEKKEDGSGFYTLGVPFNKSTEVMYYNKTFFDWASAQDSSIKVPSTWDEVYTVSNAILNLLKNKGLYEKILGSDGNLYARVTEIPVGVDVVLDFSAVTENTFHPFVYDSQSNFFITTIRQWGGTYTEFDSSTRKGYMAFNNQATVDGLTFMQKLHNECGMAIPAEYGGTTKYSSGYFKNWQSLMTIGSSAGAANSAPTGDAFQVGVAPIPYKDEDHKYAISQGTNLILMDVGTVAQRVASWKLLKYLAKFQNGLFASRSAYYPSCEYAQNSQEYQDALTRNNPETAVEKPTTAQALHYYVAKVNSDYYLNDSSNWTKFVDPGFSGSSAIREAVSSAMSLLFIGDTSGKQLSPQEVIDYYYNNSDLKDYVRS